MKLRDSVRLAAIALPRIRQKFQVLILLVALTLALPHSLLAAVIHQTDSSQHTHAPTPQQPAAQQPATGGTGMTLGELERVALANNPTLAQAQAAIRAAEGRRKQAGLLPNPVLGYQGEEFAFRAFSDKAEHVFFFEQEIPLGGKLSKGKRVFEKEGLVATAEAEAQRLRVLNAVRLLYYRALGAERLVETRRELAKLHNEAVGITEELQNVGQADMPDQLDIEIEAQRADLDLVRAENEQAQTWQTLASVVGNPLMPLVRLAGDLEAAAPNLDREQLTAFILQESPEVKAAKARVERAQAVISRAKAERAPDLILRGGLGYNTEKLELGDAPFPRRTGPEANIEVGFRVPLFNRNQGNIAAAEADLAAAESELRRVEFSLRARLGAAFTNYQNAQRTAARYRDNILPRARRAYELYQTSFNQMAAAYPQVLIARRSYLRAQADYTRSLVDLWQSGLSIQGFLLDGGLSAPGEAASGVMPGSRSEGDGDDR